MEDTRPRLPREIWHMIRKINTDRVRREDFNRAKDFLEENLRYKFCEENLPWFYYRMMLLDSRLLLHHD